MLRFIAYPSILAPPERVAPADAIYVLGMATEQRLARGIDLIEQGISDQLVVTVSADNPLTEFCTAQHEYTVHCVTPDPLTTRGEAQQWQSLATRHSWDSVALVTMRSHATRAAGYFDRCTSGDIQVIDDRVQSFGFSRWLDQFVYESGAIVKFALSRGC